MTDVLSPQPRPRGALPTPRHILAAAMPHRLVKTSPPQHANVPPQLSNWGNRTYGMCVTSEEAFAKMGDLPGVFVTEQDAVSWARQHGWLNGAYLTEVMDAMQRSGLPADGKLYQDGGYSSVDWTNRDVLCNAIYTGPVKIGVSAGHLEAVVGTHNGWFCDNTRRDNAEDHCVSLCGYGPLQFLFDSLGKPRPTQADPAAFGYLLFTWGTIGVITEGAMQAITSEAWVRNPTTAGYPDLPPEPPPSPPAPPPVPPVPPTPPKPEIVTINVPIQPVIVGGVHIGHVPAFSVTGTIGPVPAGGIADVDWWKAASDLGAFWSAVGKRDLAAAYTTLKTLLGDFGVHLPFGAQAEALDADRVSWFRVFFDLTALGRAITTKDVAGVVAALTRLAADFGLSL